MTRMLDPQPVRFKSGPQSQRTAILGLLESLPEMYVFEPRQGYVQERDAYRSETVRRVYFEERIIGASSAPEVSDE